jgi:hypothetical protein
MTLPCSAISSTEGTAEFRIAQEKYNHFQVSTDMPRLSYWICFTQWCILSYNSFIWMAYTNGTEGYLFPTWSNTTFKLSSDELIKGAIHLYHVGQGLAQGKKGKGVQLHAMEALGGERRYSSYSYLTSALDGGEWSASHPGRALPPGKGPPVPIG